MKTTKLHGTHARSKGAAREGSPSRYIRFAIRLLQEGPKPSDQTVGVGCFAFPNDENAPTHIRKRRTIALISLHVSVEFGFPICFVVT